MIDPQFLIVSSTGGSTYTNGTNNLYANNVGSTNTITPTSINSANANITLQANTDVIFNSALAMTNNTRTLTARVATVLRPLTFALNEQSVYLPQ